MNLKFGNVYIENTIKCFRDLKFKYNFKSSRNFNEKKIMRIAAIIKNFKFIF